MAQNQCFPDPESTPYFGCTSITGRDQEETLPSVEQLDRVIRGRQVLLGYNDYLQDAMEVEEETIGGNETDDAPESGPRRESRFPIGSPPALPSPATPRPPAKRTWTRSLPEDDLKPKAGKIDTSSPVVTKGSVTPRKPPKDNKEYRVIKLSSGLQAVLIRQVPKGGRLIPPEIQPLLDAYENQERLERQTCLAPEFPLLAPFAMQNLGKAALQFLRTSSSDLSETTERGAGDGDNFLRRPHREGVYLAVVVNTGSTDDPEDCLGLAHFTEHMVHYGSRRFPEENEYLNFMFSYGFTSNAFTQKFTTTYFNVMPESLVKETMQRLASLLGEPKFDKGMTDREILAVDSEFQMKKHIDFLRSYMLFQELVLKPAKNPVGKFSCGTETTLRTRNIHTNLRNFHKIMYTAEAMTLGIKSTMSLDEQEAFVRKHFAGIPRGERRTFRETPAMAGDKPVDDKFMGKYFILQGLHRFSELQVFWSVPSALLNEPETKTVELLRHILGTPAEGGLNHYLSQEELIWYMMVTSSDKSFLHSKTTTFLCVEFLLTPKGTENVGQIVHSLFSYLDQLSSVNPAKLRVVFDALKLREERKLNFGRRGSSNPAGEAVDLATALQYKSPEDVLVDQCWEWESSEFSADAVGKAVQFLKERKKATLIQTVSADTRLEEFAQGRRFTAPYTGATYVVATFPKGSNTKVRFSHLERLENRCPPLPRAPHHFGVFDRDAIELPNIPKTKVVSAVYTGCSAEEYKGICLIHFLSPTVGFNARSFGLSSLWTESVMLELLPINHIASLAGVGFNVVPHQAGISVAVNGFPEALLEVVKTCVNTLFKQELSPSVVSKARAALIALHDLHGAHDFSSNNYTSELLHMMTCRHSVDGLCDALTHIKKASLEDVTNFSLWFKRQAVGVVILSGNVPDTSVATLGELMYTQPFFQYNENDSWKNLTPSPCTPISSTFFPGTRCLRIQRNPCSSFTNTVKNFYVVGRYNTEEYALWRSCLYFIKAKAFHMLRTQKQFGYAVHAVHPQSKPMAPLAIGVSITATASKHSLCDLDKAIDQFMVDYGAFLEKVTEDDFTRVMTARGDNRVVSLVDMRKWYHSFFGNVFAGNSPDKFNALGINKLSIQFIGNGNKDCVNCPVCESISGYTNKGEFCHDLTFAQDKDPSRKYFISEPIAAREGE